MLIVSPPLTGGLYVLPSKALLVCASGPSQDQFFASGKEATDSAVGFAVGRSARRMLGIERSAPLSTQRSAAAVRPNLGGC